MKISTRLNIAVVVSVVMVLIVGLTFIFSYRVMEKEWINGDRVRQIRSSVIKLNNSVHSYILYHEERPKQQFRAEHDSLMQLIAGARFADLEQQRIMNNIRSESESINETFLRLTSYHDRSRQAGTGELSKETEQRLVGQLLVKTHFVDTDASLLRSIVDKDIKNTLIRTITLASLIIVITIVPLGILLFRMRKGINASLAILKKGTEIIGAGNLNHRIAMSGGDELAELSRSFDIMTVKLQDVTVSADELQKEVEERKLAQEQLKKSEEKYAKTFRSNPACIGLSRLKDGLFIEANEVMLNLLGYREDEFIGHSAIELSVWNDSADRERMLKNLMTEGWSVNQEYWLRTKTGQLLLCNHSAELINIGDEPHLIFTFFDITERKRAEQELLRRTALLEEANKELESFSYTVSHDLRAPLRAIDGYTRMILKKQGDKFDEDTRRRFNEIRSSTQMMGNLVDDLLDFSRLGRKVLSMSKIDMAALIGDVWKELPDIPGRNINLTINSMPPGYGDRILIKQVYTNLLSNAVKFTKNRDTARIEVGGLVDGNEDVYYVKDNGVGFNMQYCDKLFGVFQRLHKPEDFEGTGIGLAIVHRIIVRHGGRVWAEGKEGEGATFYFSLVPPQTH